MWHAFEYSLLVVPGIILVVATGIALGVSGRRAPVLAWMLLAVSGASLAIFVALFKIFRTTALVIWSDRFSGEACILVACGAVGVVNAMCVRRMVRSRVVLPFVLLAPPAALGVGMWFERGTHGRWYIQDQGWALTLSIAVWYATYALLVGVPLIVWASRHRLHRDQRMCAKCGYDLKGLPGHICPECGASPPVQASPLPAPTP